MRVLPSSDRLLVEPVWRYPSGTVSVTSKVRVRMPTAMGSSARQPPSAVRVTAPESYCCWPAMFVPVTRTSMLAGICVPVHSFCTTMEATPPV